MKDVDDTNFEEVVLQAKQTVFVDFWAPWCAPCRAIAASVQQLADNNPDVLVVKVNVDDAPEVTAKYGIRAIPTLMVFQAGKDRQRIVGGATLPRMQELLEPDWY